MQQQDLHSCIGAHHGVQEVDPLISVGPKAGLLEEKPLENLSWLYQKLIITVTMFKDKLKIQGWWEPKRSAASNVTYAQLRSSAHQYRHCLFWLWNCICRNSFLYRENRPDGNQENFSFSQRRSEQTSKKTLSIPAFSPAISPSVFPAHGEEQTLAGWNKSTKDARHFVFKFHD